MAILNVYKRVSVHTLECQFTLNRSCCACYHCTKYCRRISYYLTRLPCQKLRNNGITGRQLNCLLNIYRLNGIRPVKRSKLKCCAVWLYVMAEIWTRICSVLRLVTNWSALG